MNNFWDERYLEKEYVYGKDANVFLKTELDNISVGRILFPCEGEGRNAVYAAQKGWVVDAFDTSIEGFKKANDLAKEKRVSISYKVADALTVDYPRESFDAVALIYSHFPDTIREQVHHKIITWLKPNGVLILEAFNPNQLNNTSGGPKDLSLLYTEEMLVKDFKSLTTLQFSTEVISLNEGKYHQGKADVIRLVGKK